MTQNAKRHINTSPTILYLQVTVLQVAHPKCFLTVVESQHGFHSVHKQLKALLYSWDMVGQACILVDLSTNIL